ncbi:hypothetical protein LLE49_07355 [Alicyclobacillus tolerans]|uniref:hypothetical protein n=1 Tax=Alicyclobacillus tolerans TaxID=90970 RepID=UPI001F1B9707|nr:hypothetical protein [Alicyclobacillus tolerans]MCF8564560.1 hypothetical protein [Alicyclobacillus tolerans]
MKHRLLLGISTALILSLAGCGQIPMGNDGGTTTVSNKISSNLPSWMLISTNDVSSISVQGWGPGADGNFVVNPPARQSTTLINSLVNQLLKDKSIEPHVTAISQGGADWLQVKLKDGSSLVFAGFPNEPRPFQYNVTLANTSGKQEKNATISDDSGVITSTIQEISNKGVMVREKKH